MFIVKLLVLIVFYNTILWMVILAEFLLAFQLMTRERGVKAVDYIFSAALLFDMS